jgi:hypothetical protein
MRLKLLAVIAAVLSFYSPFTRQTVANSGACSIDIPVQAILPNGIPLIGLSPDSFDIRAHGRPAALTGIHQEIASTRILLLLDASRSSNVQAWKMETSLSQYLAAVAPPQISLALVVADAKVPSLNFMTSREMLKADLANLASGRPATAEASENIYGGMEGGLKMFGAPEFGDAVFAFVGGRG